MNNEPRYVRPAGRSTFVGRFFESVLGEANYPRTLIQLFTRKNFGERYLSATAVFVLLIVFAGVPIVLNWGIKTKLSLYDQQLYRLAGLQPPTVFQKYLLWYVLAGLIFILAVIHGILSQNQKSSIRAKKYSYYPGRSHAFFYLLPFAKKNNGQKTIEIFYEPLIFIILGIVLQKIGRPVIPHHWYQMTSHFLGLILIIASIWYSVSYIAGHQLGRDFVLDNTDSMIRNDQMSSDFSEKQTAPGKFYNSRPAVTQAEQNTDDSSGQDDEPRYVR